MLHIGCHLSASKGYLAMGREALAIGADTFQYFSRNPRGGNAKAFDESDASALIALMQERAFAPIVTHAPYTLNPCAARPEVLDFARRALSEDLARLEFFPGALYNLHPGSHVGQGSAKGVALIAETLNLTTPKNLRTTVLLETMAGKGSEIGGTFEEIRAIIDLLDQRERVGVCLDTCQKIGLGTLGAETFRRIVRHPALRNLPFILETPNDLPGYAAEIRMLREWA